MEGNGREERCKGRQGERSKKGRGNEEEKEKKERRGNRSIRGGVMLEKEGSDRKEEGRENARETVFVQLTCSGEYWKTIKP